MGNYGRAAINAATMLREQIGLLPRTAWEAAVDIEFPESKSSRDKGCPKDAFLGLCETGAVEGVLAGNYTSSTLNREYALRALEALRINPSLSGDKKRLWNIAVNDTEKSHNSQMDVVIALFHAGVIR